MDHLKMHFPLKMGIFHPAMLVYQRVFSSRNRPTIPDMLRITRLPGDEKSRWPWKPPLIRLEVRVVFSTPEMSQNCQVVEPPTHPPIWQKCPNCLKNHLPWAPKSSFKNSSKTKLTPIFFVWKTKFSSWNNLKLRWHVFFFFRGGGGIVVALFGGMVFGDVCRFQTTPSKLKLLIDFSRTRRWMGNLVLGLGKWAQRGWQKATEIKTLVGRAWFQLCLLSEMRRFVDMYVFWKGFYQAWYVEMMFSKWSKASSNMIKNNMETTALQHLQCLFVV